MKINSIYISAFGGIKNLKLDFTDGFNVILGNNENGKTTIMSFIKMMFYGSDRGTSQISKNIRKKYTPWDLSAMGGSIDFTQNGKNYRLEREFRSSNSTDKVTLCDLDFGTRQVVGADIGNKIFGISAQAFERSVFIGQFGFPEKDATAEGEINSKLSNLVLTGDESVSFETVNTRLEKAKLSLMSKSGRAGELDKNIKQYNETCEKIESAEKTSAEYDRKIKEISLAEEKVLLMQKRADELKKQISSEQDVKNAQKLREFLNLKSELDNINQSLRLSDGTYADDMYLNKLKFCISKVDAVKSQIKSKLNEINTLEKSLKAGLNPPADATEENARLLEKEIAELQNNKKNIEEKQNELNKFITAKANTKKSNLWMVFLILVIICSILTGVLAFLVSSVLAPTVAAAVDAVLICTMTATLVSNRTKQANEKQRIIDAKNKSEQLKEKIVSLEKLLFDKKIRLETINTALSSSSAVLEHQQKMLSDIKKELEVLVSDEKEAMKPLLELYSRYKTAENFNDIANNLDEISRNATKQKEIKNQINFILRDIGSVSYDEAEAKLKKIEESGNVLTESDFEAIKIKYDELMGGITEHKTAIASAKASAKAMNISPDDILKLKKQYKELEETIISQKNFCQSADIAMETLRDSFGEIRRSYSSVLEKRASEIFCLLTGNRYKNMSISKAFDINVSESENFGSREIDYLSSGTADQAYLSLRLALAQFICDEKDSLPIMLDDSLAQYDDDRMNTAIEFLKQYSANFQTIMFTCHNAVNESAIKTGANSISLKN